MVAPDGRCGARSSQTIDSAAMVFWTRRQMQQDRRQLLGKMQSDTRAERVADRFPAIGGGHLAPRRAQKVQPVVAEDPASAPASSREGLSAAPKGKHGEAEPNSRTCHAQTSTQDRPCIGNADNDRGQLLAKVELFHRRLVRREVWRQKFDLLYRRLEKKVEEESGRPHASADTAATSPASSATRFVDGAPSSTPASSGGRKTGPLRQLSKEIVAPYEQTFHSPTVECDEPSTKHSANRAWSTSRRNSFTGGSRPSSGLPRPRCGSARRCGARDAASDADCDASSSACGVSCSTVSSGRPSSGCKGVGRLLRTSASAPSLLPQNLRHVCDVYYDGNEVFLHEDILNSFNAQVFPLRAGSGKTLPHSSLDAL